MNRQELRKQLTDLDKQRKKLVSELCRRIREENVIPLCNKRNIAFNHGYFSWSNGSRVEFPGCMPYATTLGELARLAELKREPTREAVKRVDDLIACIPDYYPPGDVADYYPPGWVKIPKKRKTTYRYNGGN